MKLNSKISILLFVTATLSLINGGHAKNVNTVRPPSDPPRFSCSDRPRPNGRPVKTDVLSSYVMLNWAPLFLYTSPFTPHPPPKAALS